MNDSQRNPPENVSGLARWGEQIGPELLESRLLIGGGETERADGT